MRAALTSSADDLAAGVSLDALFRSNARARPSAVALASPRASPLSYAAADKAVERLARRLRSFRLPPGSVVAIQLPNIPVSVVSLLGVLRAGLVAAVVPMPWRRSDLVAALSTAQPKASISVSQYGDERPAEVMCEAAAELFQLSFPCAFGAVVPDGAIALDQDDTDLPALETVTFSALGNESAIITFDAMAEGFRPAARGHSQWLAVGLAVLLEAKIESGDTILTTLPANSFAGVGASLVPWLLSGGTLKFVDAAIDSLDFNGDQAATHLIAPAGALEELAGKRRDKFASCVAVHRSPRSHGLDLGDIRSDRLADLFAFGEQGAVVLKRTQLAKARAIPIGPIAAPSSGSAPVVIETHVQQEELLLRGPMLPSAFANGRIGPGPVDMNGFTRTGYRCHAEPSGHLRVDEEPRGVVTIGGLRFGLADLQARITRCVPGAKVDAVPDELLGQRIRITADDPLAAATALRSAGHGRMIVDAVISKGRAKR